MKTELHEPDEPWPEELREQVHDLKLKLKQLMSEIWIYCESGGFERGEPVDVPAMMKTLRTMGLMDR
ncbi:hypothetical protein GUITHDRAFT_155605 [Guillardia theta CCMP2712]|uniref:Uncharacterized protein n=1 Tax=Guillardia theta (strain CCMP2712) TaxID=905079 RepID=L1IFE3_GUITC|nr:hypothetical protein GUITHDRAFT_155605 [Guillardia theta CCMP2712]EKX34981.1 hypothetical protein GUITHDRAFT_155605 [Guillardia theta CCMP2712]|eukprot:XP_005821961.1 hypothetical protein GUITHDRAFT_155605 [Guillardia theta CCMP2712]